ncbi:hypothetical protein DQ237_09245 [Blastococcus sp. TF02-8]|uniref:hypothetical protein n=1 Tax=Blastococcus sp. TF02-8 TaxID=2250574 RepID=UPI000DE9A438|nr:hypothetical protein [Blastococcus sp. TF02-8]RBY96072.1 hypothetical protein DQ237_09245 [Blastococcus sp. TF02-8]
MDLLSPLLTVLAAAVLGLVIGGVRMVRARRRRGRLHDGAAVACRARLAVGSAPLRSGRLHFSGARATWRERRDRTEIDLTGARFVSVLTDPRGGFGDDVELRLSHPGRTPLRVALQQDDAATLVTLLAAADGPPAPEAPETPVAPVGHRWQRSRWAMATTALAAAWVLAWTYLVLGGETVTATVTGADPEYDSCDVSWTREGETHESEVDCDGEPAGAALAVWAMAPPFTDAAVDPEMTVIMVPLLGGLFAAPGAWRLVRDRRRRLRPDEAPGPVVHLPVDRELPALSEDELVPAREEQPSSLVARLTPYALRQVPENGWEEPRRPLGAGSPVAAHHVGLRLLGPVVALLLVLAITTPWPYRWYVLASGTTGTATGTVTDDAPVEGPGPLPDDVLVRYLTPGGSVHLADVATGRLPEPGETVTVQYAVDDPGWARLVGRDDRLGWGAVAGVAGVLLAAAWAGLRCRQMVTRVRAVRRIHSQPPRPAVGLLTADAQGDPIALVCDPVVSPARFVAVPLMTPLPQGTAAALAGEPEVALTAHGRLADGELVVLEVAGRGALLPVGPASVPDASSLLLLLDSAGSFARFAAGPDGDDGEAGEPVR